VAADDKYTVRLRGDWWDITRSTRRRDAHNLSDRLGSEYMVWNKRTRRESKPKEER
jgi:hypothetical protein